MTVMLFPQSTPRNQRSEAEVIFPGICPQYLQKLASGFLYDNNQVVNAILDLLESDGSYPKRSQSPPKRKFHELEDKGDLSRSNIACNNVGSSKNLSSNLQQKMKQILCQEFPRAPAITIERCMKRLSYRLPLIYSTLSKAFASPGTDVPFRQGQQYLPENLNTTIQLCQDGDERTLLKELQAARLTWQSNDTNRTKAFLGDDNTRHSFGHQQVQEDSRECECCFEECREADMVHCGGVVLHWFCTACAGNNAKAQVGLLKHELRCMSTNECDASFSESERAKFLDEGLTAALNDIEQEAILRITDLEDLARCPFCTYAAEYPSVESCPEFQCLRPSCAIISCRICKKLTHSAMTCDEAAQTRGVDSRHKIEEARSAALIRNCNKCNAPFIKESGCNKMQCPHCKNVQCYVCSEDCDYNHFNDVRRGGKSGNCPLFEITEYRHENDILNAERRVKQKILVEDPKLDPEQLEFHMSDRVTEDDQRRVESDPYVNQNQLYMHGILVNDIQQQAWRGRGYFDDGLYNG